MGNRCSPCCRKLSQKSPSDDIDDPLSINYRSSLNHHSGYGSGDVKMGGYAGNYSKDYPPGYGPVSGIGVNGEYGRPAMMMDSRSRRGDSTGGGIQTGGIALAPIGDGRGGYNAFCQPSGQRGKFVVMTDGSDYMLSSSVYKQSSSTNLQHISEREPDDTEADPSLNPLKETLFMQRSIRDVEASFRKRRSIYDRNISRYRQQASSLLHRSSSCSTVLLDDSTVTRPDPKTTVRALAHAVFLQIKNRDRRSPTAFMPEIFDERLHPVNNDPIPTDYGSQDPDNKVVYRFIRTLFQMAQLSPECAIVTMVYLERLLTNAETELTPATWKRVVLCAILLASKVWDDQAVWNVDYCQILKDLNVNDVNELERQFLEIIQFNINVPSSVYTKYYFAIRSLCRASCQPLPLSMERAYKLEACSHVMEDNFMEDIQRARTQRRCNSVETLSFTSRFRPTIIS